MSDDNVIPLRSPIGSGQPNPEPRRFSAILYVTEPMEARFSKEELETAATVVLFHSMACDPEANEDIANEQISLEWVENFLAVPGHPRKLIRVMAMVRPINNP